MQDEVFMKTVAIELSRVAVEYGNEPFDAVLVKNKNEMVFTNENQIYTRHDPTFHGKVGLIPVNSGCLDLELRICRRRVE